MESSSVSDNSYQKSGADHLAKKLQKFEGFDFLRAIFSLAIVAYKTKVFNIPKLLAPSGFTMGFSDYVLSGLVGALAVPVFLQISLFIFYAKSKDLTLGYFLQKRLPRLLSLYLFWVISITIFDILFVDGMTALSEATSSVKSFILFIVSGNSTPYFFFFSLLFITIVAEGLVLLLGKLKKSSQKRVITYWLLIGAAILVFASSTLEPILQYTGIQSSFLNNLNSLTGWDYNPLNFLPYVFTAAITAQEYSEGKLEGATKFLRRKLYLLLGLTLFFFILEWVLTSNRLLIQVDQAPLDHYMRLSLVFGSWLLLYLALLVKVTAPSSIRFLSDCSLGIYGFHVFFTFKKPLPLSSLPVFGNFFQVFPVLQSLTAFFVTLFGSIALTLLFKKIKILNKFV
ncbi:MAG: acyltransferase [Lyngbya sp. HA4199-MV5]|jgi:hypothetical protein|nr:acyltransferase [Lyngbya sp. HA4199-MV5]